MSTVAVFVCFSQDELLAELKRLEKDLDEILFEDRIEEKVPCPQVTSTPSTSHPGKNHLKSTGRLAWLTLWMLGYGSMKPVPTDNRGMFSSSNVAEDNFILAKNTIVKTKVQQ